MYVCSISAEVTKIFKMASQHMSCPYCRWSLAASRVGSHLGQRVCIDRKAPSLKVRRIALA